MVLQKHNCRRYNRRGVTCPFLALEQPEMDQEEGDVLWTPNLDPGLPPWAFAQVGALYEWVARAEVGEGLIELQDVVSKPEPIVREIQGENLEQDVPFIPNIPEVNIPWTNPIKFYEQYVKQEVLVPSQGLAGGLERVIQLALQWQRMQSTDAISSLPLNTEFEGPSEMDRTAETLYAEALAQVRVTWTQDDLAQVEEDSKPGWYWAGLAAATVALFSRVLQDTSSRVVPFTGRQTGGQTVPATRAGGGGGNMVNTAAIMREKLTGQARRDRARRNAGATDDTPVTEIPGEQAALEGGNIHIL